MSLSLGLGLTRNQGGASDPYATAIAAYDMARAGAYTESAGRVDSLTDFGPNGYTLTQAVSGDRPTVGTMTDGKAALVFTNTEEWLYSDDATLGTLFNVAADADFTVTIVHEFTAANTAQTLVGWTAPASSVNEGWIGINTTGDLRIFREITGPASNTVDSAPAYTTATTYVTTVTFSGGLVNAWVNGVQVLTDQAFAAATGTMAATRFLIGARDQGTDTQGVEGYIHSVVIEAN